MGRQEECSAANLLHMCSLTLQGEGDAAVDLLWGKKKAEIGQA
jgi:hypothetical protein